MKRVVLALSLAVLLAPARTAHAHATRVATLDIEATSKTSAKLTLRAPPRGELVVEAPFGCSLEPPAAPVGSLRCADGVAGKTLTFAKMGRDVDVVVVRMTAFADAAVETSVVTSRSPNVSLPGRASAHDVALRYLGLGIEHVLSGLDHVLFLIALFWQAWVAGSRAPAPRAGMLRELAATATGFTAAHSVTLAATVLGVVHVPSAVAEALIAWSLVLVALDIGDDASPRHGTRRKRVAAAATFGLVHGLGFASALSATRLAGGGLAIALAGFNVGVEVGQLMLLATCALAVGALRRAMPDRPLVRWLGTASAYAVGSVGAAMFFLRAWPLLRR